MTRSRLIAMENRVRDSVASDEHDVNPDRRIGFGDLLMIAVLTGILRGVTHWSIAQIGPELSWLPVWGSIFFVLLYWLLPWWVGLGVLIAWVRPLTDIRKKIWVAIPVAFVATLAYMFLAGIGDVLGGGMELDSGAAGRRAFVIVLAQIFLFPTVGRFYVGLFEPKLPGEPIDDEFL